MPSKTTLNDALDDRGPLAPARHALDVQLILDAIYRSAARGREARIRP